MGKYIRQKVLMLLAIVFICAAIFPLVFVYCISLLVQGFVNKQTAAKMDEFWDAVGKPYDYLIKAVE